MKNTVILVDADGVLLNWQFAFEQFMDTKGYNIIQEDYKFHYNIERAYGITMGKRISLIREFNESAAIGFLPPHRDAIHYVKKLHEEHGYVFHCITSLSDNKYAQELRIRNLKKLFGETVFDKFVFLDTGADKDEELAKYKDTECVWVEDKIENALIGKELGLTAVLMEHCYNLNENNVPRVKTWKELYQMITEEAL